MFILKKFQLCSCSNRKSVYGQVIPIEEHDSSNKDDISLTGFTNQDGAKSSTRPEHVNSKATDLKTLEKDIFGFLVELKMEFSLDASINPLADPSQAVTYSLRPTIAIDTGSNTADEVIDNRQSKLRRILRQTVSQKSLGTDAKALQALIDAVISAADLLEFAPKLRGNMAMSQRFLVGPNASESAGIISLEGCLAISDITLAAMYSILNSSPTAVASVVTAATASQNQPQSQPQPQSLTLRAILTSDFYTGFERVVQALQGLSVAIDYNSNMKMQKLLCQTIAKTIKIIRMITMFYGSPSFVGTPNSEHIMRLVSALQSLASSIVLSRKICGEWSFAVCMMFWTACEALLVLVRDSPSEDSSSYNASNDGPTTPAALQGRSASSFFGGGRGGDRLHPLMKSTLLTSIHHSLTMSAPAAQELYMEISRLRYSPVRVPFGNDSKQLSIMDSSSSGNMQVAIPNQLNENSKKGAGRSSPSKSNNNHSNNNSGNSSDNVYASFRESFRLRYVLEGLQHILLSGALDNSEHRVSVPQRDEWMCAVAESLLFVLDHPTVSGIGLPQLRGFRGQTDSSSSSSSSAMAFVPQLGPVLAEMLLEITFGMDAAADPRHDWIFWELAKRLSNFNEQLKRKRRTSLFASSNRVHGSTQLSHAINNIRTNFNEGGETDNMELTTGSAASIDSLHNQGHYTPSSQAADVPQMISSPNLLNHKQSSFSLKSPLMSTKTDRSALFLPIGSASGSTKISPGYMIGDLVDGLCTLQNGTQRWYAGKITAIHDEDGTYSVAYLLDGELHEHKAPSEIRCTKSRANSRVNSALSTARSAMNTGRRAMQPGSSQRLGPIVLNGDRRLSADVNATAQELQGMLGLPVVMTAANILRQKFAASPHSSSLDHRGGVGRSRSASNVKAGDLNLFLAEEPANGSSPDDDSSTEGDQMPPRRKRSSGGGAELTTTALSATIIDDDEEAAAAGGGGVSQSSVPYNNVGVDPNSLLERMADAGLVESSALSSNAEEAGAAVGSSTVMYGDRRSPLDRVQGMLSRTSSPGSPAAVSFTLPSMESKNPNPLVAPLKLSLLTAQNEKNAKAAKNQNKTKERGEVEKTEKREKDGVATGTKGASPRSGRSSEEGSEDGSDGIFEIPSVFGTARTPSRCETVAIPKMSLANLDYGSSAPVSSGMSLSFALLRDNPSDDAYDYSDSSRGGGGGGGIAGQWLPELSLSPSPEKTANSDRTEDSSGMTKMPSWRPDSDTSARGTAKSTSRAHVPRPSAPISEAHMLASQEVAARKAGGLLPALRLGGISGSAGANGRGSAASTGRGGGGGGGGGGAQEESMDDMMIKVLIRACGIVTAIILQRCIVGGGLFLDLNSCNTRQSRPNSPTGTNSTSTAGTATNHRRSSRGNITMGTNMNMGFNQFQNKRTNILFSVREFLDIAHEIPGTITSLAEISNISRGASMRVLKLLSSSLFQSCLPQHMRHGENIGEGGFGSVFKVSCTSQCPNHTSLVAMESLWKSENIQKKTKARKTLTAGILGAEQQHTYAVKRIQRERSVYDNPLIYDIFNEVSSLEALAGNIGVCELIDFGVDRGEYWLVMEIGLMNLCKWREDIHDYSEKAAAAAVQTHALKDVAEQSLLKKRSGATEDGGDNDKNNDDTATIPSVRRKASLPPSDKRQTQHASSSTLNLTAFDSVNNLGNHASGGGNVLNLWEVAMCLSIFADCTLILQSVHEADVLHFDIKASNFIFRCEPDLEVMRAAHAKGQPSGMIFLADFGEAIPHATEAMVTGVGSSVASRSRGTLPIQSPEMLALTQSGGGGGGANPTSGPSTTAVNAGGISTSTSTKPSNKITFPSPGIPSDIWSLGCLFVELLTEKYLFADRPWTDLYVSLCMEKFQPLPLESTRKFLTALKPTSVSAVEDVLVKTMVQDPAKRMPIVKMFSELMLITSRDSSLSELTPAVDLNNIQSPAVAAITAVMSSGTLANSTSLQGPISYLASRLRADCHNRPLAKSHFLLKPVGATGRDQEKEEREKGTTSHTAGGGVTDLNNPYSHCISEWSREVVQLHSSTIDFGCGLGVMLSIAPDKYNNHHHNNNNNHNSRSHAHSSTVPTPQRQSSTVGMETIEDNVHDALHFQSTVDLASAEGLRGGEGGGGPARARGRENNNNKDGRRNSRDDGESETDTMTELRSRIDAIDDRIYFASLSTVSKRLAEKTVAKTARDQGVFHIEIVAELVEPASSSTDEGARHHASSNTDEGARNHASSNTDEGARHHASSNTDEGARHPASSANSISGAAANANSRIQRIVIPISVSTERAFNAAPSSTDSKDRNNPSSTGTAGSISDAAVMKAVGKALSAAQATLLSIHPPTILITVVPLSRQTVDVLHSLSLSDSMSSSSFGGGALLSSSSPSQSMAALSLHVPSQSHLLAHPNTNARLQSDTNPNPNLIPTSPPPAAASVAAASRRGGGHSVSEYSKVALTLAVGLADHFCKCISHQRAEQERISLAAALIKNPDAISAEVRMKPVPKANSSLAAKSGEGSNSFRLVIPDMTTKRPGSSHTLHTDHMSPSAAAQYEADNNRRKNAQREATFSLSQSVSIVAPWLHKACHSEFEEFLESRINL